MITSRQLQDTNIAEVSVEGPVSAEDYESLRSTVEHMLRVHEQINLLMTIESIDEMTPQAMWEDLKMAEFLERFERMAMVGDQDWLEGLMKTADPVLNAELHAFEPEQREVALQWLSA